MGPMNQSFDDKSPELKLLLDGMTQVKRGDFSVRLPKEWPGIGGKIADTFNELAELKQAMAGELQRLGREVGKEGRIRQRANPNNFRGSWGDMVNSMNELVDELVRPTTEMARVVGAVAKGDLSQTAELDSGGRPLEGEFLKAARTVNTMVNLLGSFTSEVTRVAREVGTEGKLGGQAVVLGVAGTWKDLTDNVNFMASNLTSQVRNIAEVTTAVANGDLSTKITADVRGEFLQLKDKVNTMVDQLSSFASEVTRVAREVGTEGKLGGQAIAPGAAGTWKDLTDNVNFMASNLTSQVRNIADITTAVANGDFSKKITADVQGEFLQLKDKVNTMVDQLRFFTSEVTRVAREVGVEGRLGQQAIAPGAAGTWKELTDNVNQLAANLTTQVRAIADVAISVTKGDLTRSISMDARGEVENLKDTLNQMIGNLRVTSQKDADQVWLKTNLARFALMLQGQTDLQTVSTAILTELSKVVGAQHGVFYLADHREGGTTVLKQLSTFAYQPRPGLPREFAMGEGLVGQCARDKERILISAPRADYIKISSGLGEDKPSSIVVLPILFETRLKAVLELASFEHFSATHMDFLEQLMEGIGIVLNTLEANLHTETLLKSLQTQQEELHKTNQALEEKADQLTLTSKYKSAFLSNMSHELRTPLNSMLILSQLLSEDPKNLPAKQIEYAKTIHASGGDLLTLINDILDLARVESGTLILEMEDLPFTELQLHLERVFRPLAKGKGLKFSIEFDSKKLDRIHTDGNRLEQILRNLLSNAFKFTEKGEVTLKIETAAGGWNPDHPVLSKAGSVIAFTVTDTGIGISGDKQKIIFDAFQQADSSTSRKYGGTGLGLSISRELAKLLGCQLALASSTLEKGSTFVLYVANTPAPQVRIEAEKSAVFSGPNFDGKSLDLSGKKVLVVDDDLRNIFAMTSLLETNHMTVQSAESGAVALELLAKNADIDVVLMDIMMPDMDGYATMQAIRKNEHFKTCLLY